jgi:PAS domain S-box-containing protein
MSRSTATTAKGRSKVVAPSQNFLVGLEFEKSIPLFPMLADLEFVFPEMMTKIHLYWDAIQIVAFGILPYHQWGWVLDGILRAVYFSHIPLYDSTVLGLSYTGTIIVCAVVVGLFVASLVVAVSVLLRNTDDVSQPFFGVNAQRFQRFVWYATSVAFVPIVQNLMSIAYCRYAAAAPTLTSEDVIDWYASEQCNSPLAQFSVALCVVGVAIAFGLSYLMNVLVYDSLPQSRHFYAKAHAMLDVPMLLFKVTSCALMHYFHMQRQMVYFAVWTATASLALALGYMFFLPYYRKITNQIHITALLLCSFFSIFSALTHDDLVRAEFVGRQDHFTDLIIFLVVFGPVAWFFWTYCALARTSSIFLHGMQELHEGRIVHVSSHMPRNLPPEELLFEHNTELLTELMEGAALSLAGPTPSEAGGGSGVRELNPNPEYHFTYPYIDYITVDTDVELSNRFLIFCRKWTGLEPTKFQLGYAASIYMKGALKYRQSSHVRLSFALFLMYHAGKPRLALQQVTHLRTMQSTMPERMQGYKLFTRLSSLLHIGQNSRVEALSRAKRRHREALHHTMEFWQLLLNDDVDKTALSNTTRSILAGKEDVHRVYKILLSKNPSNLDILACYTTFCETLLNDNDATQQCLQCLREGRELKTANTMRGAKVKGDTGTMTQIPLDFDEEDSTGEQTEGIKQVHVLLVISTALLGCLLIGFLILRLVTSGEKERLIAAVDAAGQLRGLASQCAAAAYDLRQKVSQGLIAATGSTEQRKLLGLQRDFAAVHNSLSFGEYAPKTSFQVANFRAAQAAEAATNLTLNLWTLGSLVSVALRDIAAHPLDSDYFTWVTTQLPRGVHVGLDHAVSLTEDAYLENETTFRVWCGILLCLALATIASGCVIVFYNIHKIEGVRADIFSLFTLIPRRVVRRLFRESRKRYTEMDLFFSLSTKKKLTKLIGADASEPQQVVELNLDDEARKQSMSGSEVDSRVSSSMGGAGEGDETASETGGAGTPRRRGKRGGAVDNNANSAANTTNQQQRQLQFLYGSDSVLSLSGGSIIAGLFLGAAIVLILSSFASTLPKRYHESYSKEWDVQRSISSVTDSLQEMSFTSRGFVFTGKQRYFERFIGAHHLIPQETQLMTALLALRSTDTFYVKQWFSLLDFYRAIRQRLQVAVKLATSSYPSSSRYKATDINATLFGALSWPNEEHLLFTSAAPRFGFLHSRQGLLNGSAMDLALPATDQLSIAKAMVSWETLEEAMERLISELEALRQIPLGQHQRDETESMFYPLTLAATIIGFLTCVKFVFLALRRRSSPSLRKGVNTLLLVIFCAAIVAASALCLAAFVFGATGRTLGPFPEFGERVLEVRSRWEHAVRSEIDIPRLYLHSGNLLWNNRYRSIFFDDVEGRAISPMYDYENITRMARMRDDRGDFSRSYTETNAQNRRLLTSFQESMVRVKALDAIAVTLTYHATSGAAANSAAASVFNATYLSQFYWDFPAEPDYWATRAIYGELDNNQFYTNRTNDLGLLDTAKVTLATNTLFSRRCDDLISQMRSAIRNVMDSVWQQALQRQRDEEDTTARLLTTAFSCASVAVSCTLMLGIHLFIGYTQSASSKWKSKDSNDSASSSSASNNSSSSETRHLFLGYGLMTLLVVVLAIISAVAIHETERSGERVNYATERAFITSRTMLIARRMLNEPGYFTEGHRELKYFADLALASTTALYFRRTSEYFSVGHDGKQDALSFQRLPSYAYQTMFNATFDSSNSFGFLSGSSSADTATAADTPALITTSENLYRCNVTLGSSYLVAIGRGVGLAYDHQWTSLLQRLEFTMPGELASIVQEMEDLYEPLILGLTLSDNQYREFEIATASRWNVAIVALTIAAVVCSALLYFLVLRRFTDFLAAEESGARLMLRIIPQDARDSNKQIASFLESGRVKQTSDDLSSAITSMSTHPVIAIDQKGIIMRFSQAAETVFKYSSSEVVGMNVKCLMPEEFQRNHDTYLANYRRTRVKHVVDTTRRVKGKRKGGEIFPLELRVMEMRFGDESVYIGFAKDISSEVDLAVQDQLNKYVLDMSRDSIITIDGYGQVLNVNQAVTTVFGYGKDEMLRENIKMLMPSEIALNHDGYLARYRETGIKNVIDNTRQVQGQRKNGEIFHASVTVREIKQINEPSIFIGFVVDVTEEHEAAMLNEVNDIISDLSPVPIVAINDKGNFVKFSRAACTLFQYSKEELIGRGQNIQLLVPPKFGDHNRFLKAYLTTGQAKVIGTTRNIIARRRDKSIFPATLTLREIRKQSMQPVFLGYIVDITQSLQLEEAGKLASEIMRFSMIPIVVCNLQGIIMNFNFAAEQAFGYNADEVIGHNVKMLTPRKVASVHDNFITQYLATKEKTVIGLRRIVQAQRKNGDLFPADLTLRDVPESEHGEGCFFAYIRDVTSHRETLQQFMINESITQLSVVPIIAMNNKGLIESFSPAAEECFGYSSSDVMGENIKMLMPIEIAEKHDEYLRRYRRTGVKTIVDSTRTVTAKRRDGTFFQMEISVREIRKEGTQNSFVGYCRDTSRDTQLEEERQLGAMIRDLSVIPIVLADSYGDISYINQAFAQEFQYTVEEAVGKNLKMLMAPEIAVHHDGYLEAYRNRGPDAAKASTIVGRVRRLTAFRKDGTDVAVEAKVAEIRSGRSGTLQLVGFIRNLGTQLLLEQANQTIDTITNLSLVPIVAIDHRGIVIKFSMAAELAFGYESGEILGNNVKSLMPEEIAEKHDGYLRTYLKTHVKTVVGALLRQEGRRKDGTRFPLELAIKEIVKHGQNPLFIGYLRDASQDTALERAMQLSTLVTELSPIPIIVISRQGAITTFNIAASDVFEYTAEEVKGQDISMLMTGNDALYHGKYLKTYAKTKIKSAIDAVRTRTAKKKSGQTFTVEVSVKEIIPSSGDEKSICYLGFVRDMTAVQILQQAGMLNDTIANISCVPLIVITSVGQILKFSKSAEACFGFESADVIGKNVKMLMPPEIAAKHDDYLSGYKKRPRVEGELQIERFVSGKRRTGEVFPAKLNIREVRKQGQEPMFVGYLEDMSNTYEILRKKAICEASINLSAAPIIAMSPSGIVRSFNEAAEDCFGYTRGEIIGNNVKVLMPRKTAEYHDQFLSTYLQTGVKHVVDRQRDVTCKRKNGKRFAACLSVREFKEHNEHFFVGYVQDRSNIAALEQATLVNEAIIQMSVHGVIAIDSHGIITQFSPSSEKLFGYRASEVYGKNISMLMPDPWRSNHDNYLKHYGETRIRKVIGATTRNLRGVRRDHSEFSCELTVSEVEVEGWEHGFVATIVDITDRIQEQVNRGVAKASEEMSTRALIAIDAIGTILRCNGSACSLFEYEPREVLGKNVKMLMPQEIAVKHDQYLLNYKMTGIKNIIDSFRSVSGVAKSGKVFEIDVHVKEVKLADGTTTFLAYLDDVSKRKELSIASVLSSTVMSLIPRPIVIITSKGIVKQFNHAAEVVFEFDASQVIGRNVNLLMPIEVQKWHDDYLKKYLLTGEKHVIDTTRKVEGETKTGKRIALEISVREVKLQGNEIVFVGFLQPI